MLSFITRQLVIAGLGFSVAMVMGLAQAKTSVSADSQVTISQGELPRSSAEIYTLIYQGGPFANVKDGVVFGNRERLLPARYRGYYREYTVPTPGLRSRGVKRIVCGGGPKLPDVCYYSADHYASFRRIVP